MLLGWSIVGHSNGKLNRMTDFFKLLYSVQDSATIGEVSINLLEGGDVTNKWWQNDEIKRYNYQIE